jgi:hypothetical protein
MMAERYPLLFRVAIVLRPPSLARTALELAVMDRIRKITIHDIEALVAGRFGIHDVPCPICSPSRKAANRRKRVMRIWRDEPSFVTYHCVHCGVAGYSRDASSPSLDPAKLARIRAEAAERERVSAQERVATARRLWLSRLPIACTAAETYLREARGYDGPLPATLGFLPAQGKYPPAMIAVFGVIEEPEPGILSIADNAVRAVHLTRLKMDGTGKAGTDRDKIMIGRPTGSPIVLAPITDSLGLAISEGIENALTVHAATGLGAWAAGSASHLPSLAKVVPCHIDIVTVVADGDAIGRRSACDLASGLLARGIEVEIVTAEDGSAAA